MEGEPPPAEVDHGHDGHGRPATNQALKAVRDRLVETGRSRFGYTFTRQDERALLERLKAGATEASILATWQRTADELAEEMPDPEEPGPDEALPTESDEAIEASFAAEHQDHAADEADRPGFERAAAVARRTALGRSLGELLPTDAAGVTLDRLLAKLEERLPAGVFDSVFRPARALVLEGTTLEVQGTAALAGAMRSYAPIVADAIQAARLPPELRIVVRA